MTSQEDHQERGGSAQTGLAIDGYNALVLRGETIDGAAFRGTAEIRVVNNVAAGKR